MCQTFLYIHATLRSVRRAPIRSLVATGMAPGSTPVGGEAAKIRLVARLSVGRRGIHPGLSIRDMQKGTSGFRRRSPGKRFEAAGRLCKSRD